MGTGAIRIGTAGWNVPGFLAPLFPPGGSHLARYGQVFGAVEVDSSFYRHHRPETWARWAATVPPGFRFAVKLPKALTHEGRLRGGPEADAVLERFLGEVGELGPALGPLLVQLPPSLAFEPATAFPFLEDLRDRHDGLLAWEPRHWSWFTGEAEALLRDFRAARVAADPAVVPAAALPGGWPGLVYLRLHGSPVMYRSRYPLPFLEGAAEALRAAEGEQAEAWCVLDNTAEGWAAQNALELKGLLVPEEALPWHR